VLRDGGVNPQFLKLPHDPRVAPVVLPGHLEDHRSQAVCRLGPAALGGLRLSLLVKPVHEGTR
jgi:hypothetical protein